MVVKPEFGSNLARATLEKLSNYLVVTQKIPWDSWSKQLTNLPLKTVYCKNMELATLEYLARENAGDYRYVVGLGGGVACDTGKFLAQSWNLPLITIPSIISVDAFLCPAIGIREESRVRYIDAPEATKIIIDYDLLRTAPNYLNYAGVGDVLSCATALGDWKMAAKIWEDSFDEDIYQETVELMNDMLNNASELHYLSDKAFQMLVNDYLLGEVILSDKWGNARMEEGSEHFLAYCLEKLYPRAYPHGSLVGLCVLIVLKLQGDAAVFSVEIIKNFLDIVGVQYSPNQIGISRDQLKNALESVSQYTRDEKLFHGLWYLDNPFQYASIKVLLDWVFSF